MKRGKSIITLILTLAMVFSSSAFAVFADTATDQEEQLDNAAPKTEEVAEETPEVPAAITEQAGDVQEQGIDVSEPERETTVAGNPIDDLTPIGGGPGVDNPDSNQSAGITIYDEKEEKSITFLPSEAKHGYNWAYAPETKTLTLTNYSSDHEIIYYGTELNIELHDRNEVKAIIDLGIMSETVDSKLVIFGSGSININGSTSTGLMSRNVEIRSGSVTIKSNNIGIMADIVSITGGEVNIDADQSGIDATLFGEFGENHKITIKGGKVNVYGKMAGLLADTVDISGGVVRTAGSTGIEAMTKVSFSGDIYVEAESKKPEGSEYDDFPAVWTTGQNGISVSNDVQIVLPENGKVAPYDRGVSGNEVGRPAAGTMIADASGKLATHVIIERIKNPSGMLLATAVAKGKTDMELSWTAMNDVDGYDVFFAPCNSKGKTYEPQLVATVKADTTSYTVSGLKKGTPYKAYVQAYITKQGAKQYVGSSLLTHAFAGGSSKRFTNPKSVKVKKSKVSVKTGKKYKIRASVRKVKKSKKLIRVGHAPKLRYLSSNTSIATVSKKGNIKGVAPGTCTVYAIAANGVYKAVNVTVK